MGGRVQAPRTRRPPGEQGGSRAGARPAPAARGPRAARGAEAASGSGGDFVSAGGLRLRDSDVLPRSVVREGPREARGAGAEGLHATAGGWVGEDGGPEGVVAAAVRDGQPAGPGGVAVAEDQVRAGKDDGDEAGAEDVAADDLQKHRRHCAPCF